MHSSMFSFRQNLKIANLIILFIAIYVMYDFITG